MKDKENENTKYLPFAIGWHGRLKFILPVQEKDVHDLRENNHKPGRQATETEKILR